jgi:hypothetical protein
VHWLSNGLVSEGRGHEEGDFATYPVVQNHFGNLAQSELLADAIAETTVKSTSWKHRNSINHSYRVQIRFTPLDELPCFLCKLKMA